MQKATREMRREEEREREERERGDVHLLMIEVLKSHAAVEDGVADLRARPANAGALNLAHVSVRPQRSSRATQ